MARACALSQREGRRCLQRQFEALALFRMPCTGTPDEVHDLRVATRRCRVVLSEFKPNLPPAARRKARHQLQRAGRQLGGVRELDVWLGLLDRWKSEDVARGSALAEVRRRLETERQSLQPALQDTIRILASADFANLLARLDSGLHPGDTCQLKRARKRLTSRFKDLRRQYRTWRKSEEEDDLHLLRIGFKKFRYTLETHAHLYGPAADDLLDDLKRIQDVLGDWNDYRLLRDRVAEFVADASDELSAPLRDLVTAIESDARQCVDAINKHVHPLFAKDEFKRYESLFAAPIEPCCRGAR